MLPPAVRSKSGGEADGLTLPLGLNIITKIKYFLARQTHFAHRRSQLGIQQCQLCLFLSNRRYRAVFHTARALSRRPEFCPARVQPVFLCLRGAEGAAVAAFFRAAGLGLGAATAALPQAEGAAGRCRRAAPGSAVLVQIRGLRRRDIRPAPAGNNPAHRHLLLHLPGPELRHRRLPRRHSAEPLHSSGGAVYILFPPAHSRPHRPLHGCGGRYERPVREPGRRRRGRGALHLRPGQEMRALECPG